MIFMLLLFVFPIQSIIAQNITAKGSVYEDQNMNNSFDEGEKGIPSVAVSNGHDVVLTDKQGKYVLNIDKQDAVVFVIKPAAYNYPTNELNLPQYYYLHKPEGSPEMKYPGVAPTGALPAEINFALIPVEVVSEDFSVLVFSDPQPYALQEIDYYTKSFIEELKGADQFAFGFTLGDLVGDRLDLFEPLTNATSQIGLPWFNVLGNHDMNYDATTHALSDETFEEHFGPSTYAFSHGKVHFIVLDNIYYPYDYNDRFYTGGLTEQQFEFVENDLKYVPQDALIVLLMHIPLFFEKQYGETFIQSQRQRLFNLLSDRKYTFSMSGHTHTQRHHFFDASEDWNGAVAHHHYNIGTISGDWWSGEFDKNGVPDAVMRDGTPKGYVKLHFEGNKYSYDYKVYGKAENHKMRIYGPKLVPQHSRFNGEFYVNFFEGSENCQVSYRYNDEEEWKNMRYVVEQDPYIAALRYRSDTETLKPGSGARPSNPSNCYHLWKVRGNTQLPLGTNIFKVRVTDRQGREHFDEMGFEVMIKD